MSALVIDLQRAEDTRDVVHRCVEAISAGKVIALPTETVYGLVASALHPEAVQRIYAIKGRQPDRPLAIAAKSFEDALDYAPNMSPIARRIARRSWPGPVTLVHRVERSDSVIYRLDERVREATIPDGKLALRVPDHELTQQIMRLCAGPIVMTSANASGGGDAATASQVAESIGDRTDLIVDAGPCKLGVASSVIEVDGMQVRVLREGGLTREAIRRLSQLIILVVCTGNTCRSPMGEAILKRLIANKLGCSEDDLLHRGIQVASAGISAMPGGAATPQAVDVMSRMDIEIGDHASQPLNGQLAQYADLVLTMTNRHRQALISQWPLLEPRTRTVRRDGGDIADPIGSPLHVYDACAKQISDNLHQWVDSIDWAQFLRSD